MPKAAKPSNPLLAEALRLGAQGLPVFPCKNEPTSKEHKKPLTKHGFKDAKTDATIIRKWWKRWPNALIGMPTGEITDIAVLDLDKKNDKDGFLAIPDWEARTPIIARTPSGGAHLYFKTALGLHCTESAIAPGVDTRADGGYVIVPPSPGYTWVNGADFATLPPWPDDLRPPERSPVGRTTGGRPEAEGSLVAAALAVIPNVDLGWGDWNRIGMATWRATKGSDDGLAAFMAWSKKSKKKYNADVTTERWQHFASSPPTEVGAGTLFYEATKTDPGWRTRAIAAKGFPDVTVKGGLRVSVPNSMVAIAKLGVDCRHDLFKLRYIVNGHEIESFVGEVADPGLLRLCELVHEHFDFYPAAQTMHTAVRTLANHHRFHPVRDYLDGLQWDGVPRIDNWLTTYGEVEDNEYTRAVGALVLTAAVRRVREPGCKFDEILVLENPEQGNNRSSALQMLAVEREWFSDNLPLGASAKETIEALSGHWILEASELQGMRKGDIEKIKAFASRDTDRARMAYDRAVTEARRQCVIIGTTNSERYLRDLTGNRRFWPVRTGRFDLDALKRDRDQLWAEAAVREASGASIRLPERLWPMAAAEQRERVVENPFVSVLDKVLRGKAEMKDGEWVDGPSLEGKVATEDVWTIIGVRPGQRSQQHFEWLGDAMKQLGWERTNLRVGGGERAYFYIRGPKPYRRITVVPIGNKNGTPPVPVASYDDEGPAF